MQTLLLVDDEADIVTMLQQFFTGRGYRVLTACDGPSAIQQAACQPDLILLDISMPGLDGLEVCRRIRQHVSAPILFLTARIDDTDKVAGFAVGGDDYIVKPFSLLELEARVAAHLRREVHHQQECHHHSKHLSDISHGIFHSLHPASFHASAAIYMRLPPAIMLFFLQSSGK